MNQSLSEEALVRFSGRFGFDAQIDAAKELVREKVASKLTDTPEFCEGVQKLALHVTGAEDPEARLRSLATMELLRAVTKSKSKDLIHAIKEVLDCEPPSSSLLADGNERFYVASAINFVRPDWSAAFAAREVMAETTAESARAQMASALAATSPDIASALIALSKNVGAIRSTELQAETNGRVARRVLAAFRMAIAELQPPPGDDVGGALRQFAVTLTEKSGPPQEAGVVKDLTNEFALTILAIVRVRFSLMLDRQLYSALATCRRWSMSSAWAGYVEKSGPMSDVRRVVSDAIRLSARLGVRDSGLTDSLDLCSGSRERTLAITRGIADEIGGAAEHVRFWLLTGVATTTSAIDEGVESSQLLDADRHLARALLLASTPPTSNEGTVRLGDYSNQLASATRAAAERRGLELFGEIGNQVSYSPLEHVWMEGQTESAQGRVMRQGVRRRDTSQRLHILVKAILAKE